MKTLKRIFLCIICVLMLISVCSCDYIEELKETSARRLENGNIEFDGHVYIRHDSEVTIDCSRLSKIFISVYDNAKVNVTQRDGASVYVYLHGENCSVESDGEVMIRRSK